MRKITVEPCSKVIELGRYGENEATAVYLPLAEFEKFTPGGTVNVLVRRPDVTEPSPVSFNVEGGYAIWVVGEDQLAVEGYGEVELRYVIGETRALSRVWSTRIGKSLLPVGDTPPDPFESWYERVLEASEEAQEAAERAETASRHQPYPNTETGTWWVWDGEINAYKDTGVFYGASTYVHSQGVASNTWTINHNLGKYPSVTVTDSTGRIVVGGVQYVDANTVILTFSGAFSGTAYLN